MRRQQPAAEGRHSPFSQNVSGAGLAVVFTHGIMGSPRQFDDLVAALGQTCSIENLLLPGHGATSREYADCNIKEWQRYLDEVVDRLSKNHDRIILVGHSLGSLLSVCTALAWPDKVKGLFLIATPLRVGISSRFIRRSLAIAFSRQANNPEVDLANQTSSVHFPAWYNYLQGSGRVPELFTKSHQVRHLISRLSCPVCAFWSEQDEIVDIRSSELLPDKDNFRKILIKNSGHYIYSPEESQLIRESFLHFVEMI